MIEIPFTFPLANGLHARPASQLQEICLRFTATILLRNNRNRNRADARSILELVASNTLNNDPCLLEISGPQQDEAARALRIFLSRELPLADDDMPQPASAPAGRGADWLPPVFHDGATRIWPGLTIAPGIGRGRAVLWQKTATLPQRFAAGKNDAKRELKLFKKACLEVESDLQKNAAACRERNAVAIIKAHLAILADPGFRERINDGITGRNKSAGQAIAETTAHYTRILEKSSSIYLQERVGDLEDLAFQLVEKLYGPSPAKARPSLHAPCIVVAATLNPSELLGLERRHLRGLVLGPIGLTSHTAILARSFGIPAVSLPLAGLARIGAGSEILVDGRRGLVIQKPGPGLKRYYRLEATMLRRLARRRTVLKMRPAQTHDRLRIEIAANVDSAAELEPAWRNGADAVGLFRSETLFLERDAPPGEDEQFAAYSRAVRSAKGRTVIIRTLDIGGDKRLPYLALPPEENPYLGFRAVRFYGEHGELIRCQLRAILRAAACGSLKVMVPMVTALEEVRLARSLLAEAAAELRARKIPHAAKLEVGIMVETPAAALSLESLAREADFFSVGSNDLLQYFLAVDRGNPKLENLYDPLHPAFLRLLEGVGAQARGAKRWLGICGEMAGNPEFLPLLVGAGFDELSMAPQRIAAVKERMGELDSGECRALLQRSGRCTDAGEVRRLLDEFNGRAAPIIRSPGADSIGLPPEGGAAIIAAEWVSLESPIRTPGEAIKELCGLLELAGRVSDASALEEAVWKRETTFATDLGFGFALPHGKAAAVKAASIAFLRPRRPMRWGKAADSAVRAVLLIAIPDNGKEQEHLRLIAGLSRRLMNDDFREMLLTAKDRETVLAVVRAGITSG